MLKKQVLLGYNLTKLFQHSHYSTMSLDRYQLLCSADFHQGNGCFSESSRGNQCVSNCFMFLVVTKFKRNKPWSKNDLHFVLYAGDYVYTE